MDTISPPVAPRKRGRPRTDRTCEEPGCGRPHLARGYCEAHYQQWRRTGRTHTVRPYAAQTVCRVPTCDRMGIARGYCQWHYTRWYRHGPAGVDPYAAPPPA